MHMQNTQPSQSWTLRLALALTTLIVLILCQSMDGIQPLYADDWAALVLVGVGLVVLGDVRTPSVDSSTDLLRVVKMVTGQWLLLIGVMLFIVYVTGKSHEYPVHIFLTWFFINPVILLFITMAWPRHRMKSHADTRSCIIVGGGVQTRQLLEILSHDPRYGLNVVGVADGGDELFSTAKVARLQMDDLAGYVKRRGIKTVFVAASQFSNAYSIQDLIDALADSTASVYSVPDPVTFAINQATPVRIGNVLAIAVCESPMVSLDVRLKRFLDVGFVLLSTPLTLLVGLIVALAVKLESAGPVFFRQRRYGLDGKEIMVYKFRSMKVLEDGKQVTQARQDDDRITRVGRFIRRTSLDEMPQLINVLQGDMSLVGPRPHAVAHNELYRKLINGYMIRHKMKPGMTGLAQVRGHRGETDRVEKMVARVQSDLEYLSCWSVSLDIWILLRTIPAVLSKQNAY